MWCDSIHLVCSDLCMKESVGLKVARVLSGMCRQRRMGDMYWEKRVMNSVNCQYHHGRSTENFIN